MAYILPSTLASLISTGQRLPEQDRQVQECLSLIEASIRQKASEGLNKVHLLDPRFAGWDKNNLESGPVYMSAVFDALLSNGYGFFTETSVPVHESMGPLMIPYVHTSVTWGKVKVKNKTSDDNALGVMPPPIPDNLQSKLQESLKGDLEEASSEWVPEQLNKFQSEIAGEWVLEDKQMTDAQIAIAKSDFDLSMPSQKELDLGASEAYFRESPSEAPSACPMPGNPSQLLSNLYQQGYHLPGYNNVTEQDGPRPPCSIGALSIISGLTCSLAVAHKYCQIEAEYCWPRGELMGNDMMYVLQTFSLRGFDIEYNMENEKFQVVWKPDAWDRTLGVPVLDPSLSPVPATAPVDQLIIDILTFLAQLKKKGIHLNLKGVTSEALYNMEKAAKESYPDRLYCKVLRGVYGQMVKGETLYVVKCSTDEALGRMMEILRAVGLLSFSNIDRSEKPFCQVLTVNWELPKC